LRLTRAGGEYIVLPNPPLTIELNKRSLALRSGEVPVEVSARLFDHGAASIIFKVPISEGTTFEELIPLADELYDSASVDQVAAELNTQLRQTLAPALESAHLWEQSESYTVIFAEKI